MGGPDRRRVARTRLGLAIAKTAEPVRVTAAKALMIARGIRPNILFSSLLLPFLLMLLLSQCGPEEACLVGRTTATMSQLMGFPVFPQPSELRRWPSRGTAWDCSGSALNKFGSCANFVVVLPVVRARERGGASFAHSGRDHAAAAGCFFLRDVLFPGILGYLGDGANRWPAGHVLDVGHLYRLALEKAPAGSQLYAAAEEGITVREITETIGRHLNVPAVSIPAEQAADHFKAFPFITLDITMSNADTRQLLDWEPVHRGLIADLEDGHYFTID
jgi:hypothetical protein